MDQIGGLKPNQPPLRRLSQIPAAAARGTARLL